VLMLAAAHTCAEPVDIRLGIVRDTAI